MGFIVYVTDKHKGEQITLDYDELRDFPIYRLPESGELSPRDISRIDLADDQVPEKPIVIELSEEAHNEKQKVLEEIISRQQHHIIKLEQMLKEKGVSDDEMRL